MPIEQDSTVSVTASEIKYANLIFVEHKKLIRENTYLCEQVDNLQDLNKENEKLDSLRCEQITEYDRINKDYLHQIDKLSKDLNKKNKVLRGWQIGGITVSVGLILFLLLR